MSLQPPTDKPSLASYESPAYRDQKGRWLFNSDIWEGDLSNNPRAHEYLPKEFDEPDRSYAVRLKRSPFDNRFRPTVEAFSGVFAQIEHDTHDAIASLFENVDRKGSSLSLFLNACDVAAMRDKYCFVLVSYPTATEKPRNRHEEQQLNLKPFLKIVYSSQVVNWSTDDLGLLKQATIRESHIKKQQTYGAEYETLYRVVTAGTWKLIRIIRGETSGKWIEEIVSEGIYAGKNGQPFDQVPLVPYSLTTSRWFDGNEKAPFDVVADLNLQLYRESSDHSNLKRKLCFPVPCAAISPQSAKQMQNEDGSFSLGANSIWMLGENGNLFFAEPSGSSLAINQSDLERVKQEIRFRSIEFLTGQGFKGSDKTATEVKLSVQQISNTIARMGKYKSSAVHTIFMLLGQYLGIDKEQTGTASTKADLRLLATEMQDVIQAHQGGIMSLKSATELLHALGLNPDPEVEMKLIQSEETARVKSMADSLRSQPGAFPEGDA